MGYYTDFSGSIDLPDLNEKDLKRLENILKSRFPDSSEEVRFEKTGEGYRIAVWGNWKNYNDEIQKLVMAIVRAFPASVSGWIDAYGEERDDRWAVEVGQGKVMLVTYEEVIKERTVLFDAKGGRHHD